MQSVSVVESKAPCVLFSVFYSLSMVLPTSFSAFRPAVLLRDLSLPFREDVLLRGSFISFPVPALLGAEELAVDAASSRKRFTISSTNLVLTPYTFGVKQRADSSQINNLTFFQGAEVSLLLPGY